jgi:hypothetical protein
MTATFFFRRSFLVLLIATLITALRLSRTHGTPPSSDCARADVEHDVLDSIALCTSALLVILNYLFFRRAGPSSSIRDAFLDFTLSSRVYRCVRRRRPDHRTSHSGTGRLRGVLTEPLQTVTNNCGGTIWPAMADIGGSPGSFQGWEASPGFSKTLNVEGNFVGRICTPS